MNGARRRGAVGAGRPTTPAGPATGRPPRIAAAFTASPAATPENPQRVPPPRFPGPWMTTATSASPTCRAASRPVCTSSPPDHPRRLAPPRRRGDPAHVAQAGERAREPRGQAPPSVITYATRAPAPAPDAGDHRGQHRCRSATTTGMSNMSSASPIRSWRDEPCSSDPDHADLQRGVPGLHEVPGPEFGVRRWPVRHADHDAYPPVPSPGSSAVVFNSTRLPDRGRRRARGRPGRGVPPSSRSSSAYPGVPVHRPSISSTPVTGRRSRTHVPRATGSWDLPRARPALE